jgi:hypothetical protein
MLIRSVTLDGFPDYTFDIDVVTAPLVEATGGMYDGMDVAAGEFDAINIPGAGARWDIQSIVVDASAGDMSPSLELLDDSAEVFAGDGDGVGGTATLSSLQRAAGADQLAVVRDGDGVGGATYDYTLTATSAPVAGTAYLDDGLSIDFAMGGNPAVVTRTFDVTGITVAANLSVRVGVEIDHSFPDDVLIELTAPDGTTTAVVISDGAWPGIDMFIAGSNGTVGATGDLDTAFDGLAMPNGTWTLTITDTFPAFDGGTLMGAVVYFEEI